MPFVAERRGTAHTAFRLASSRRCNWPRKRRSWTSNAICDRRAVPARWLGLPATPTPLRPRRLAFLDFWPGFEDETDQWLHRGWFRRSLPGVEIVDPRTGRPDVVLFSVFGPLHRQVGTQPAPTRPKLVFFTGENVRPPIGKVPLCLSFDHAPRDSSHVRLPLWILNAAVHDVLRLHEARLNRLSIDTAVHQRGFCSWVASNASMYNAQLRLRFVQRLSATYREVACGGTVLNNVGGPVPDKMQFLQRYKFNICFENASWPGYCTEKLLHAFAAGTVPVYWGDPHISSLSSVEPDFNPKALISAHDFETEEAFMAHIEAVDRDPALLERYLQEPILSPAWYERLRHWDVFCSSFAERLFADCT